MSDNHIITVPVNGQLQIKNNDSDLTNRFLSILSKNANSGLDLKKIQKKEMETKANLVVSMSEIKSDVFTPTLLDEYTKVVDDIKDFDNKISTLESKIKTISNQIEDSLDIEELSLLKLKKDELVSDRLYCKKERSNKADYMLEIYDQFAYKETFKEKNFKKDEPPDVMSAMMAAMMAGAGVGIANAATDKANDIIKEKTKKNRNHKNYNTINPDLKTMYD